MSAACEWSWRRFRNWRSHKRGRKCIACWTALDSTMAVVRKTTQRTNCKLHANRVSDRRVKRPFDYAEWRSGRSEVSFSNQFLNDESEYPSSLCAEFSERLRSNNGQLNVLIENVDIRRSYRNVCLFNSERFFVFFNIYLGHGMEILVMKGTWETNILALNVSFLKIYISMKLRRHRVFLY